MLDTSIIFLTLLKPTIKIITIMELWMQLVWQDLYNWSTVPLGKLMQT